MLSIKAVRGLRRLRASGIVPCIISFSRQLPCFLTVWPYSMLASLLWWCLTVPSLLQLCYEPTLVFSSLSTKPAESFAVGIGSIFGQRDCIHGAYSKDTEKASYYFGLDKLFSTVDQQLKPTSYRRRCADAARPSETVASVWFKSQLSSDVVPQKVPLSLGLFPVVWGNCEKGNTSAEQNCPGKMFATLINCSSMRR